MLRHVRYWTGVLRSKGRLQHGKVHRARRQIQLRCASDCEYDHVMLRVGTMCPIQCHPSEVAICVLDVLLTHDNQ